MKYVFVDDQDAVVLFAAGNNGGIDDPNESCSAEANGKNIIAVGSSETTLDSSNITYVAFYSSKGPAYDGR